MRNNLDTDDDEDDVDDDDFDEEFNVPLEGSASGSGLWRRAVAVNSTSARCRTIVDTFFTDKVRSLPRERVVETYAKQSVNVNVFYRATASIFWTDFVDRNWDDAVYELLELYEDNDDDEYDFDKLIDKSTWTWVTGDQHLSNFGGWRNRHDNVVFGVNDFDEAAIYDFHIDVLRLAVSITNHAAVNGLSKKEIKKVMKHFTETYLETVMGYVGNEDALTFELTSKTAKGILQKFLKDVEEDNSNGEQLEKFTDGRGRFLRNDDTRLVSIETDELEEAIRRAFSSTQYGATMMKTGWHVPVWDDDYFAVLDVTRRLGSGVGSYGVDRFYVLLNGTDDRNIILDVKYEPPGGVSLVLSKEDRAWYNVLFRNEAARAIEAQRRLTSYVDPYTGWVQINGNAFVVRQRSPWKSSPNLDKIDKYHDFKTFAKMVATVTATSHTRGTQAKAPGEFKHVIMSIFGKSKKSRKIWDKAVRKIADAYAQQVHLDYKCFRRHVEQEYPEVLAIQKSDED